jgi:Lrp/AsnC family leucine-responsive transcriptional regulator
MKLSEEQQFELDPIDVHILMLLQEHCKMPLAKIGEKVGLSAPAVIERIKKLEDSGVITGYTVTLNARKLGRDITAFIGVLIGHPKAILAFEEQIHSRPDVLECHHVTGGYTLLLKVKTENTRTLEELISHIRSFEGVERTETMVVLSTHTERAQMLMQPDLLAGKKRARRSAEKLVLQGNTAS